MPKNFFFKVTGRKVNLGSIRKLTNEVFLKLINKKIWPKPFFIYVIISSLRDEMKDALKTLLWEGRDKEIQAGKKLIAAKNSMKYIIVTDKFKSLKRYVQWEFNFIPTDR